MIKSKKRLGQHFIQDKSIIYQIISQSGFEHSDQVLEIGAGLGALTIPLSKRVGHIAAVEKDASLVKALSTKLSDNNINNVEVIHGDILKLNFEKIIGHSLEKIHLIGNLPYNISSPFLERLIMFRAHVSKAVLMFQSEFGRRIIASPGSKAYGAMSVLIQYYAHISSLLDVSREKFYPKPKVDSIVLVFDMDRPHPNSAKDEVLFKKVVKGAFAYRRKMLRNSLKGAFPEYSMDEISSALERCFIELNQRAENLDIDAFICLASAMKRG